MIQSLSTSKVSAVAAVTAASTVVPSPSTASITKGNKEFLRKLSSRNKLVLLYASGPTTKVDPVTVGSFISIVTVFKSSKNDTWDQEISSDFPLNKSQSIGKYRER